MYENIYSQIDYLENLKNEKMQFQTDTDSNMITYEAFEHLKSVKPELFMNDGYGSLDVEMKFDLGIYI